MSDLRLLANNQATRTPPSSGASGTTGNNSNNSAMQNRSRAPSDFDLRLMPHDKIVKRTLFPWSVHHSLPTSNWIATISRPESFLSPSLPNDPNSNTTTTVRYTQFSFPTEREARKFSLSYAPPKPIPSVDGTCRMCGGGGSSSGPGAGHQHSRLLRSCRNCGVSLCDRCSCRWDKRMLPKTYLASSSSAGTVRVCKSCDWLSNAFCLSLLQGRYQDALTIHGTVSFFFCEDFELY